MAKIQLCRPETVYIITESLHHALGWGKVTVNGINVGADVYKVSRKIVQACVEQDFHVDGDKRSGTPSSWEYIKHFFGLATIEGRDKPEIKINPLLVYSGFTNQGESFGVRREIYTPSVFIYGKDPIPHVKLYGNKEINFHMPGGQSHPTAVVVYDPRNKETPLIQVPPGDQNKVIDLMKSRVAIYNKH